MRATRTLAVRVLRNRLATLVLAGALFACAPMIARANEGATEARLAAQLCDQSDGGRALVFTSPAQVRRVLDQLETSQPECGVRLAEPVADLRALLAPELLADICAEPMYEHIRALHTKYVHYYLPEETRDELLAARDAFKLASANLPAGLRRFLIVFAKQVNAGCKQHLVSEMRAMVAAHADELPNSDDFAVIERYKKESSRLGFMYQLTKLGLSTYEASSSASGSNKLESIQIMDLLRARAQAPRSQTGVQLVDDEGAKLYVQVRFDDRLKRIKAACEKRFMPLYMELFGPVVKLNNLAYVDRLKSRVEDRALDEEEWAAHWYPVIQACEVLKDVEVLHDSSAMQAIVGIIQDQTHLNARSSEAMAQMREVRILTRAQAEGLRRRVAESDGEIRPVYDPEQVRLAHKPVQFTARMWLQEPREVAKELDNFERDVERLVAARTSLVQQWRKDLSFHLKNFFRTNRNAYKERDEATAVGQLALFFERHRVAITAVSVMLSMIFLTCSLAG